MAVNPLARVPTVPDRSDAVRRLALSKAEAAAALGVSVDFFDAHVAHELRIVRRGRRRLIPMRELERWIDVNAARPLVRRQDGQQR